ncbi:TonB-dependent receptor [Steroidobacter sp.]|uniref:TonB-dependent receptor n=1 Tax=Steroidobacter sp. TaxID=1978227 RepID=UPI0025CF6352|nr:TonB-dependent receptor [Steroidobacter sp.]
MLIALDALASRNDVQLVYRRDQLQGVLTAGVSGRFTVQEAVLKLLEGTQLRASTDPATGAMLIAPKTLATQPAAARGFRSDSADSSARLAQASDLAAERESGATAKADSGRQDSENISEVLVSAKKPFTEGNMDIKRTENDAQPYQLISAEEIERTGVLNVEGYLKRNLSMNAVARDNSQLSVNAYGSSSNVNLRGIGTNQTLILINGRRTANISLFGQTFQPDVNGIPIGAVERIEVLPVSSSAIYGGSAIGGVVNVVLKRDYEGGQIGVSYRSPMDTDAPARTVDASYGFSLEGGRTNVVVGGRFSEVEPLFSEQRPELYARGLQRVRANNLASLQSPTSPFLGGSLPNIGSANGQALVLRPEYGGMNLGSTITHVPSGTSSATQLQQLGAGLLSNAGTYNFTSPDSAGTYNSDGLRSHVFGSPVTKSFIASARRRMSDNTEAFLEFYRSSNTRTSQWAVEAATYRVSAASPVNPFQQDIFVSLPAGAGSVGYDSRNEVTRFTAGVLVDLPHDWQLESDYTWTSNDYSYGGSAFDSTAGGLVAALNNGTVNPFVDTLSNPLSIGLYEGAFGSGQEGGLGNVALRVAGPVWELPAGRPTLVVGLEHRKERVKRGGYFFRDFPQLAAAQSTSRTYLPQSQSVLSAYTELKVPLVSAANAVPLVRELELQLSGRTEHFKVSTGTAFVVAGQNTPTVSSDVDYSSTNPTIGLRYKPVDQLMLRASYAKGFLPPDYSQFLAPVLGGTNVLGANATAVVIDPRRGNQQTVVHYIAGGNPDIKPQSSQSWNVGLVWEPAFIAGLRASLDWYHLVLEDVAVTPTPQQVVNLESQLPGRVQRVAATPGDPYGVGALTLVDFSLLNANEMKTEGMDLSLSYLLPLERLGTFQIAGGGSIIRYFKRQSVIDGPLLDIANAVADGGPLKRRANLALSWMRGNWKADWMASYFGSYDQFDSGGVTTYVRSQGSNTVRSQTYHDLAFSYSWPEQRAVAWSGKALSGTTVQLGISNVFDKVPPFDAYYGNSLYYSPFGDPRLREYWLSATKHF